MTTEFYKQQMFLYGLLTLLYVLQHFETQEDYEECKTIMDAIREQEKRLDTTFFTKITDDAIAEVISVYQKHGMTGENAVENSKFYASRVLMEIKTKGAN